MIGRFLSFLPLLFFMTLVIFAGYALFSGQPVASLPATPTKTPSPTLTSTLTPSPQPSPSPVITPTPSVVSSNTPSPTLTSTQTPTETPTVVPTLPPTPTPITIIWVQSNSELNTAPHTLTLNSAQANSLILQENAAAPALSPDGNKIAFYSENSQSGYNTGIWVADLIEGSIENAKLLVDVTDVQNLAWSPNEGDKLVFEVVLNPSSPLDQWQSEIRIVLSEVADGYVELDRFEGRHPAWSPDGQHLIFYTCRGSQCGLFVANCIGGNCDEASSEQLTFDSTDSYPTWSPKGDAIAFASARTDNHEIYYLRLTDKSPQNLTNRSTIDTTPLFSSSGQQLYFRTDLDGVWQLQIIDLVSGTIAPFIPNIGGNDRGWGLVRPVVR